MDTLLQQLNEKERAILADLYEHDAYKVLKKILALRQIQISQTILVTDQPHEFTVKCRGEVSSLDWVDKIVASNHKKLRAKNK